MTATHFTNTPSAIACAVLSAFHRIARGTAGGDPLRQRTLQRALARRVGGKIGGAPKGLFFSIVIGAGVFVCSVNATACPCSPCQCSPCTCGGMNKPKPKQAKPAPPKMHSPKSEVPKTTTTKPGKNESYHKGKEDHGGHSSHTEFGVGMDIDLSGIGQRRPEPDPFAVSGPPPPPRTQERPEKPKTKEKQREVVKSDPFTNVQLTGPQAKAESDPQQ
jgi:hypothetical protein